MTGIITFSSSCPASAAIVTVVSQPITWKHTWLTISGTDGFTLPGMIDEPGCTAGSEISDSPARGPMLRSRRSLATLLSSTASRRIAPEYATTSPMLCVTRNRLCGRLERQSGVASQVRDDALPEFFAGIQPGADGGGADIQLLELPWTR